MKDFLRVHRKERVMGMAKHKYTNPGDDASLTKIRDKKEEKRRRKAWDDDDLENEWYDQIDDLDDFRFK